MSWLSDRTLDNLIIAYNVMDTMTDLNSLAQEYRSRFRSGVLSHQDIFVALMTVMVDNPTLWPQTLFYMSQNGFERLVSASCTLNPPSQWQACIHWSFAFISRNARNIPASRAVRADVEKSQMAEAGFFTADN